MGKATHISSKNVHAYVIGEHGDTEFVPWSNAIIGAQTVDDFLNTEQKNLIESEVRDAAYKIISAKGNTSYGIGMCLVKITNAILEDQQAVLSVSSYDDIHQIYFGMPSIIGKDGVTRKIHLTLNAEETIKLEASINAIKGAINN